MTAPGRPLERRHVPAPRPRPGGAVLETVASEVCGGRTSGTGVSESRTRSFPATSASGASWKPAERSPTWRGPGSTKARSSRSTTSTERRGAGTPAARRGDAMSHRRVYGICAGERGLLGGWSGGRSLGVRLVPLPENLSAEDFWESCGLPISSTRSSARVAMATRSSSGLGSGRPERRDFRAASGALRVFVIGAPKACPRPRGASGPRTR